MHNQDFFFQALIYLLAAVISVPIAKRLGFGSVLGYLLAGIIIGPFVLGLIGEEGGDIMHFAEFGVIMMLFLIGLELKPFLLWRMRKSIFGLGGLQVLISIFVISVIASLFGMKMNQSVAIGMILALSSTAMVLQTFTEKGLLKTEAGQSGFSVLLFQDISVIPILAIIPLLAVNTPGSLADTGHTSAEGVASLPAWQQLILIVGVVAAIIFAGRFLARHVFRIIANTGLREIFTATALLIVIAIAIAMAKVGLSPALGTFLAGVVLADNEYRHELETDIEPFKGLLLGLFFIAVGVSIDFSLFAEMPGLILGLLGLLIMVKFLIILGLGHLFGLRQGQGMLFSLALAQGGEFAFVTISFSKQNNILNDEISGLLLIVVALSMTITPLLLIMNEKIIQPFYSKQEDSKEHDTIEEDNPVIIAGFGRFGVMVGRFLAANGIKATILDDNPKNIDVLRKFGHKVYYGDASRPDLLDNAGAESAKILILALDNSEKILEIVDFVKKKYPHLKIFSRALDVKHSFELREKQVDDFVRETYGSSLNLGKKVLNALGFYKYQAERAAKIFNHHDEIIMKELYQLWGKDIY